MKRVIGIFLLAGLLAAPVWADPSYGDGRQCPMKGDCPHAQCAKCDGQKDDCGCPIMGKFMKKAGFFLKNAEAIGLSEEQVASIKALKLEAKKVMIQQKAGMETFGLDIEAKLSEPKLDVAAIHQMIDTGMAGMTAEAKASVDRYAKLKAVLSDEQMKKAKELWKKTS